MKEKQDENKDLVIIKTVSAKKINHFIVSFCLFQHVFISFFTVEKR